METKLKLITANDVDLFEERLNKFLQSLKKDEIIVDVKYTNATMGNSIEYSALIHYQLTESWQD